MAVVVEDYQFDLFTFDQVEEFPGAGAELLLVVVGGPSFAVDGEGALHDCGVNGQENRAGVRKADEDGLMAGSVATGLEQSDAGEEFGVAVDEAIA